MIFIASNIITKEVKCTTTLTGLSRELTISYRQLLKYLNNDKLFKKLVAINLKGNTTKVVEFMNENSIKTDDLKDIEGLTKDDFNNIHSYWWKNHHTNK